MSDKPNILILVPDGTGIKNYLYSRVFRNAEASVDLFHNFDEDTLSHIRDNVSVENDIEIPQYSESVKEKYLRELIHLSRLQFNAKKVQNPTILKFWKRRHKGIKLNLFYTVVTLASKFYTSYNAILKLEKKYDKALRKNLFYDQVFNILKQHNPDVLFCTHQRALKAPTIFAAARDLGIKTVTVIYSWDNIPKARLALKADHYLVWSLYMQKELELLYPEIPSEAIKITGTPQFEFYKDTKNIIEKEDFYKTYGLDPAKKLICFSGDDVRTSPYDPHYLNDVAEAIVQAGEESKYQIIFRRCPVDISGRYQWVLDKYPDLIVDIPPLWNYNSSIWTAVYPTYDDVKLLVSLAFYADVVINVGSTMAFDFAMFNKPCIYINYDHVKDPNWSVEVIYKYQHFRSMPTKNAVYWFDHKTRIVQVLEEAISNFKNETLDWMNDVVDETKNASDEILKQLNP